MRETEVTVVGNVVRSPQRNRTANGSVTNFRIASTSRRYDKGLQGWVDNKTLFLDVECWGELGGNVSHTISKGDPVIVLGELYTDEWDSDQGRRSRVKLRAEAVGPDLTKGVAEFRRTVRSGAPSGTVGEGAPDEAGDELPPDPEDGDYSAGSAPLYEVDSDGTVPEPALH